jgi:hypothetical protein
MTDKTALSYWFPKIQDAGVPVPRTKIVKMTDQAQSGVWRCLDGQDARNHKALNAFVGEVSVHCSKLGYPVFFRTDHTSAKHDWKRTCYLSGESDILGHTVAIAEFSEICGFPSLPWDTWVVREFLPTIPVGTCPRYGSMPVCREFRAFVNDGDIRCIHPYWPESALREGGWAGTAADIEYLNERPPEVAELALLVGGAIGGAWSVDVLETKRGWFVTDMAEAHKSFHWEGCCALAEKTA